MTGPEHYQQARTETRIVGEYYRSRNGKTIHLAPCSRMGTAVPWIYADGRSLHEVVTEVAAADWLRLCQSCWPTEALKAGGEQAWRARAGLPTGAATQNQITATYRVSDRP